MSSPPTTYTPEQARREYTPKLRRAAVIELGRKFGYTENYIRSLIDRPRAAEGEPQKEAIVPNRGYKEKGYGYFDLEDVLKALR